MSNDHICEYLAYYVTLPDPGYAVMVNGTWGIGKTYAVKQFVEKNRGHGIIYVSLFGAKSAEDIDQRIIVGMMPVLNSPLAKIGGRIAGALAQKYGLSDLIKVGEVKELAKLDLIVFDDFERAAMKPVELLGYISPLVENERKKVVIIANENEIQERDDYNRRREKVIGITFDFQQDVHAALGPFIKELPTEVVRKHLEANEEALLSIFSQSGSKNLRVLKQTLWTWDRFYGAIESELRGQTASMLVVFKLFVALCLEVRSGALTEADLRNRVENIIRAMSSGGAREEEAPLAKAQKKYPELHLHDRVLTDEVLVQVLCESRLSQRDINDSLRSSEHFMRPEDEPAWQKVWYGITRPEEEFIAAFKRLEEQFTNRAFIRTGEIMHVFGLRLFLAKIGQLPLRTEEVMTQCKLYVNDLKSSERLLEGADESVDDEAAYGMVFSEGDTPEFKALRSYYDEAVEAARRELWPAHAEAMLDLMAKDANAFFVKVCWTNDERDNTFALVPIFSAVSPDDFVEKLLSLHPRDFRTVLTALKGRYEHGRLQSQLAEERPWLHSVYEKLKAEATNRSPIRRFTIENEIGRLIAPLLGPDAR
jgi:hypothetical protein